MLALHPAAASPAGDSPDAKAQVLHDVSFLGEGRKEKLDLYLPSDTGKSPRPAVVIIHGGGWQGGDKAAGREQNIGNTLAGAGYVAASINYVLAPRSERLTAAQRKLCKNASPVTYVSPDDPPALILHGTADAVVPVEQSRVLFKRLRRSGVPAALHVVEGAPYSLHLQPKQQDLRELVLEFLDAHL